MAERWRYEDRGYETPCRIWLGAGNPGYGVRRVNGVVTYVHRDEWERARGPIPAGLNVLHHCDVPACGELEHLFLGTQRDNMRDAVAKGRLVPPALCGEAHPRARLTEAIVREIRASEGSSAEVAPRYGVSARAIRSIRQGRRWKEVA